MLHTTIVKERTPVGNRGVVSLWTVAGVQKFIYQTAEESPKIVHLPKLLRRNISCIAMHGVSQQPKSFLCVFQKEPAVLAFLFTPGSRKGFISVHVDKNCPISLEIFEKYSDDDLFDPLVYCPHHPFAGCSCSRLLGRLIQKPCLSLVQPLTVFVHLTR